MKISLWYDRSIDVSEELFKISLFLKRQTKCLENQYCERKESHQALSVRVNQNKIWLGNIATIVSLFRIKTIEPFYRTTIGAGMGPTMKLAKSAKWACKEWPELVGYRPWQLEIIVEQRNFILFNQWEKSGVYAARYRKNLTRWGLLWTSICHRPILFSYAKFNVRVERTVRELDGEPCTSLKEALPPKQQNVCSRSFGESIQHAMRQAVY